MSSFEFNFRILKNIFLKKDSKEDEIPQKIFLCLFWGIFLFDVVLRVMSLIYEPHLSIDSVKYLSFIQNDSLSKGDFSQIMIEKDINTHPPFIYMLMYVLNFCGIENILFVMRGIILSMGILIPVLLFLFTWEMTFSKEIGLAVMGISACHPFLIRMSTEILRDPFFLFFAVLFFLFGNYAIPKGHHILNHSFFAFMSGCTCALACLTRFEGLELLLIVCAVVFVMGKNYPAKTTLYFKLIGIFFCAFGLFSITINYVFGLNFSYYLSLLQRRLFSILIH